MASGAQGMTLLGYVSRVFVARFFVCLAGLAALLQLLDLLDNAAEALSRGGLVAVAWYALLRLPSTLNQLIPISVLLGALAALLALANSNEIVAIRSSGVSLYRVVGLIVPATLVIAIMHFALGDQLAPRSERHFQDWWSATGAHGGRGAWDDGATPPLWMRDGKALLSLDRVGEEGRVVEGLSIFERDLTGNLSARIVAQRAEYRSGEWTLLDARRTTIRNGSLGFEAISGRLDWHTSLTPDDFVALAEPIETLSVRALLDIVSGRRPGAAGEAFYETRLQRKFALPLSSLVMLLIAAPAAAGLRRQGSLARGLGWGLAAGFSFLIIDGLAVAAGQAGLLPAALAAWTPALLCTSLAGTALIWLEDTR
jgi:lipopolysaccharide export system permease protein